MGFKFTLKKSTTEEAPPAQRPTSPSVPEVAVAESKEDWSEKTASNWKNHSGFVEISKVSNLAPPPRLDPRTVPRPTPVQQGMDPAVKTVLTGTVLALGILFGLYSNGFFHRKQKAPVVATETTDVTGEAPVIVPPVKSAGAAAPVIVPPERKPAQAVKPKPSKH